MSAIAFTLVRKTPHQLIYSFDGDAAGTLDYATMLADALAGRTSGQTDSPLHAALVAAGAQCTSDAKATSALITGETFVGGGVATPSITTNINSRVQQATATASKAPVGLTAVDSGGGNDPNVVLTPDGAATGWLYIEQRMSVVR